MIISKEKLAKAFTEWDRRYRDNPAEFMTEWNHLKETPYSYGKACALYFAELVKDV